MTVLRADVDARHAADAGALLDGAEGTAGAHEVAAGPGAGRVTLVAAFHLAGDAAAAALQLAGALAGGVPARLALSTGEVDGDARLRGPARERVDALAARGGDARVLVTASTAMMISPALPPSVELVDAGVAAVAPQRYERVYELRSGAGSAADDGRASNLGWAQRAAARLVVGRREPLARLDAAWAAALEGRPGVVVLSGEMGIGKTTLAAELALRVHAGGGTVLYGRWDEEGRAPYQALREALGTYAAACPRPLLRADLASHADELSRLLPDIGARIGGVRPPLADDPDAERLRLFDAVADWLGAIARRRPVLLVLDDLQWADRSSLLLLRHLVETPPGERLLAVLTLRDEVEAPGPLHAVHALGTEEHIEQVEVAGLERDDVTALVAQALGRPVEGDDEVAAVRWLTDETAGNPLYVHEMLLGLDPDEPAAALARARERLPQRVHDVVRWRLTRLSPATHEALAAAALVGAEFSLDLLATALDQPPLALRHRLDDATRAGVVRDTDDGEGDRLAFAHAVVRRVLQDDVPAERAAELHRRIARALAAAPDASPTEVARHLLPVADRATAALAVRWGRAAADEARRETAFEEAVWFLSQVVVVHDRFGDCTTSAGATPELACEVRLELAEAHDRAGEFTARDRRHLEAAALAREAGRTDLFVRAALGYGGRLPAAPPPNPTARALLDEALQRLPETDSRTRALTLARLAHVLHADAPHTDRRAIADEAEAMARRLDAPVVLASVLGSRVLAVDGPDDIDEHLDIGAEVTRIGEQTGDSELVLQGTRARIQPLFVLGAHEAARELADRYTRLARSVRHPDHMRLSEMWETMWAALEGRFDEAFQRADRLRAQLEAAGHSQQGSIHLAQTFVVHWLRGDLAPGRTVVADSQAGPASLAWALLDAWVAAGAGDVEAARARLAEHPAAALADEDAGYLWMAAVVGAAVVASSVGDRAWAEAARTALAPYAGRNALMGYAAYLGAVDHHLGTVETVLGRVDEAAGHLASALERHRTIGARPWVALSAAWLANTLADRDGPGDAERAAALRAEATALAEEVGVAVLPSPAARLAT